MNVVITILDALGRKAQLALVGGIAFSLVVPALSAMTAPYLPAIVVGTLTMAFARIDLARTLGLWRRPDRIVISLVVLMVVMPVSLAYVLPSFGLPAALSVALILLVAAPPLASGANFAFFIGLDAEFAVNLVLAGTFAMPFVTPFLAFRMLDLGLEVSVFDVFVRLAVTVGLAVVLGASIRILAGRERILRRAKTLDGIAAISMIVFLVAIMDGVPELIVNNGLGAAAMLAAGAAANFGFTLLALMAAMVLPQRRDFKAAKGMATVAMFAGNRNYGLLLTALPMPLYAEVAPFVALYQIPIYLTPLVMGPVFRWFIGPRPASNT